MTTYRTLSCVGVERRRVCARLAALQRKPLERCLQIWGGPERAVIRLPGAAKPIVVTRANSCGIAQWTRLQELLD